MPKPIVVLFSFVLGLTVSISVHTLMRPDYGVISEATDIDLLVSQASGHGFYWNASDQPRGTFDHWTYRHYRSSCARAATLRLGELGPAASEAVPDLIEILQNGRNDYDTGDGILPDRSAVAMALGMIGDVRAIPPLIEKLRVSETYSMNSARAEFTKGWVGRKGAGHEAIACALAMFGADAAEALPLLVSIKEDSNSMAADSRSVAQAIEAITTDTPPAYPAYRVW